MRATIERGASGTIERGARATWVSCEAVLAWRAASDATLAMLLARPLPYNLRWAIGHGTLVVSAALPPLPDIEARRLTWLAAAVERAAAAEVDEVGANAEVGANTNVGAAALETVAWIADHKAWRASGPGCFAIPGEPDLPPVTAHDEGSTLRVARSVPLLPARHASAVVRAATLHAALRLNGAMPFARVALDDEAALTFAVESRVPLDELDEDELDSVLEGVRYGARFAAGALACLRHHVVATEYAAAHDLPEPGTAPGAD